MAVNPARQGRACAIARASVGGLTERMHMKLSSPCASCSRMRCAHWAASSACRIFSLAAIHSRARASPSAVPATYGRQARHPTQGGRRLRRKRTNGSRGGTYPAGGGERTGYRQQWTRSFGHSALDVRPRTYQPGGRFGHIDLSADERPRSDSIDHQQIRSRLAAEARVGPPASALSKMASRALFQAIAADLRGRLELAAQTPR